MDKPDFTSETAKSHVDNFVEWFDPLAAAFCDKHGLAADVIAEVRDLAFEAFHRGMTLAEEHFEDLQK